MSEQASESCHWYHANAAPCYTIVGANGKERPTTLADARKLNLVPSVTTILDVAAKPGLNNYFERQIFDAALELAPTPGANMDVMFARVKELSRERSIAAAERGTALHGAIERFLLKKTTYADAQWTEHIDKTVTTLAQLGISLSGGLTEKTFAHPLGFAGKVDWSKLEIPEKEGEIVRHTVIDFKTKDEIMPGKKYACSNHVQQLAAYAVGLKFGVLARCLNVFVGANGRDVQVFEWSPESVRKGWEQFKHLLGYWQLEKDYFPIVP